MYLLELTTALFRNLVQGPQQYNQFVLNPSYTENLQNLVKP